MSNFKVALGELKETNQVVEDTVEYCESLLTQFMQQDGIDENITNEAKECVQNAIEHVVEHVNATGEQLNLALKKEEGIINMYHTSVLTASFFTKHVHM